MENKGFALMKLLIVLTAILIFVTMGCVDKGSQQETEYKEALESNKARQHQAEIDYESNKTYTSETDPKESLKKQLWAAYNYGYEGKNCRTYISGSSLDLSCLAGAMDKISGDAYKIEHKDVFKEKKGRKLVEEMINSAK